MSVERHQRLQRIFSDARRIEHAERGAFLDDACADEPDLRREIDALLAADADHASSLDAALAGGGASLLAREVIDAPTPETIGRYRVLGVIGEGGMGVVYEAQQEDPRRRVALKVVRPGMVTRSLLQRFRHEAQVLGQLQHPGIAQIYEAGTADTGAGGQPFFAMELIDGPPLLAYAEAEDLGTRERLELVAEICDAVHHAHQKGVVHRDLKPCNVLVVAEGPKILDFGVARVTDADMQTVTLQTDIGQLIGTVPYMSPEQASGDPDAIDTRSDVYALGVITFELLTGRLPYPVADRMVHEAVRVIREEEPSRLSSISRTFRGDVETIVGKALEKDKDRRYQSAAEFAADIRRYLVDEPIVARPASSLYQLGKFTRRNKALVGGVAAVVVVSIVGAIVATRYAVLANRHADALVDRERAARWLSYRASITAAASALSDDNPASAAGALEAAPVEHRGWEWDYLFSRLSSHVREWSAPASSIASIPTYSTDGARMFAVMGGGAIGEWDAVHGTLIESRPVDIPVSEPRLSAEGQRYAGRAADGRIVIGDLRTGEPLAELSGPATADRVPAALAWDSPGKRLLFTAEGRFQLWAHGSARVLDEAPFACAAFDPAGVRIVAGELKTTRLALLDAETGDVLAEINVPDDEALAVAFAPDGKTIAVGGLFRNIFLLDGETLEIRRRLAGHRREVNHVAFSPDGRTLLSSSADGTARLWDVETGARRQTLEVYEDAGSRWAFVPGTGDVLALGDRIRQFEPGDDAARVLRGHESYVYFVAISPDNTRIASTALLDESIRLWDVRSGVETDRFPAPRPGWFRYKVPVVQFTPDGSRLISGNDREVVSIDLETRELIVSNDPDWREDLAVKRGQRSGTRASLLGTFSPDGTLFASSTATGARTTVRRDGADGDIVFELDDGAESVEFSPDGRLLALGRRDGTVSLYDVPSGAPAGTFTGHDGLVYAIAFHPTEPRIATGGEDSVIIIRDLDTLEPLLELRGHEQYVMDLRFSPDGTMLVSGSGDRTVRIWDTVPRAER